MKNIPSKKSSANRKKDSQSSDWSRARVVAQMNREKRAKTQKLK